MTLTFTQENGLYVAEFEATAPFSIHLERPKGGFINMLQRSVDSGTFVAVKNFNPNYNATQVIDADCGQGAIYPKWIRIESAVEPSVAEVTFESESSGGGAGTESTIEYLDISEVSDATTLTVLKKIAQSVKWRRTDDGEINIAPYGLFGPPSINGVEQAEFLAAAIDLEQLILNPSGGLSELTPLSTLLPFLGVDLAAIPRITKEQFYNLEA